MPEQHSVTIERNVPISMRDGTVLYADVYRPEGPGQFPVLLMRTPYNKEFTIFAFTMLSPVRSASRGYAVVVQDVRGRYTSPGDFYPFRHEVDDGYDTVEWCEAQPWSNGRVGMYGASYVGATQWLAAIARPPHLVTMIPAVTASDYHEGWVYQGGAFELGFLGTWTLMSLVYMGKVPRLDLPREEIARLRQELARAIDEFFCTTSRHLPLKDFPLFKEHDLAPYFYDWLAHPEDDEYWRRWRIEDYYPHITATAFHIGGWYDIFLGGTLRNFVGMRQHGGSPEAHRGQKLMVGPWVHGMPPQPLSGEVPFGVGSVMDTDLLQLRWFDRWLKDEDNGIDREPPVRIFVMGENVWRDEYEWPLARTQYTNFYLHSGGRANSLDGDGRLSPDPTGSQPPDIYLYDPRHPVPTVGGGLCCWPSALRPGAFDQRLVEARSDVLVYSTPPLTEDVEVTGPITVTLWASSSAPDTDFTAKLVDVEPDGYARNLADSIIRARYRESTAAPKLIIPGQVYKFTIDLWATSNLFRKGHQIRLEIASSNFPRFDRNPNTGHPFGQDAELRPAVQTIYHDADHPSHVTLPLIPRT